MKNISLLDKYSYAQFLEPCNFLNRAQNDGLQCSKKQIQKSLHIRFSVEGLELQYTKKQKQCDQHEKCTWNFCSYRLQTIFLYLNNRKNSPYKKSLVFSLSINSTIKSVIMLLGEPTIKSKYLIECIWNHLGIGIVFLGNNWKDEDLKIDYIYLFQPTLRNSCCSFCKQQMPKNQPEHVHKCDSCQIIQYCSLSCQEKHYMYHKTYCQQVD